MSSNNNTTDTLATVTTPLASENRSQNSTRTGRGESEHRCGNKEGRGGVGRRRVRYRACNDSNNNNTINERTMYPL